MSLFICRVCTCVENTALVPYDDQLDHLCSEHGSRGKWHGQFPQEKYDPKVHTRVINPPEEKGENK